MTFFFICVVEAEKDFWFWFIENVACTIGEIKIQVYLMLQLAKALTTVSDFECEAIADESVNAHYRLRERWSFMERRTL